MNFVSGTYFTNLSVKVVGEGIGNSANSGFAQSMFTLGSLIIGLTFGIVMRLKFVYRYSMPIAWTIGNIGFFIVAFSHSFVVLCIGSVIQGFGTGMFVPSCLNLVGRIGGKQKAPLLVGLSCALSGLSQFAGPTLTNMLAEAIGLAHGSPTMFLAATIDLVTMIICWCIYIPMSSKHWKAQEAAAKAQALAKAEQGNPEQTA